MLVTYRNPNLSDEDFYELMCRYDDYRIVKHFNHSDPAYDEIRKYEGDKKSYPCTALEGKNNSRVLLGFACTNYTRTMIQNEKPKTENVVVFKDRVKKHRDQLSKLIHAYPNLENLCQRSMGNHSYNDDAINQADNKR